MTASWFELEQPVELIEDIFDDAYPKHRRPGAMLGKLHSEVIATSYFSCNILSYKYYLNA